MTVKHVSRESVSELQRNSLPASVFYCECPNMANNCDCALPFRNPFFPYPEDDRPITAKCVLILAVPAKNVTTLKQASVNSLSPTLSSSSSSSSLHQFSLASALSLPPAYDHRGTRPTDKSLCLYTEKLKTIIRLLATALCRRGAANPEARLKAE
ncbi:hypothetical protein INR49_024132 [Caranx melampygus]|nr:hypothetical protein INR49_024132 [Caranx melampygus]